MDELAALIDRVAAWREAGLKVALATVIDTSGSSPRPVGSQLAVAETGAMTGSASGGCVEAMIVREAMAVLREGGRRTLEFAGEADELCGVGLPCGGRLRVYLEPVE